LRALIEAMHQQGPVGIADSDLGLLALPIPLGLTPIASPANR
jgi:hypothetical protein